MYSSGQITDQTATYITTDIDRTHVFLLPNIHKMLDLPLVDLFLQAMGIEQKNIPVLDVFTNPLVPRIKRYIRDSTYIINIHNVITDLPTILSCAN